MDHHRNWAHHMRHALIGGAVVAYAAILCGVTVNASDYRQRHQIISEQTSGQVLICTGSGAYAYHKRRCQGLNRCKASVIKVTERQAQQRGYKPCGYCY